jgi:hypothetical protein
MLIFCCGEAVPLNAKYAMRYNLNSTFYFFIFFWSTRMEVSRMNGGKREMQSDAQTPPTNTEKGRKKGVRKNNDGRIGEFFSSLVMPVTQDKTVF